jgi:hypothetical protein
MHTKHIDRGSLARTFSSIVRVRATLVAVAVVGVLAGGLVALPATAVSAAPAAVAPVRAADLSQFRPGNIISNEVFFNSSTMSEADISWFLQQRVPNCQSGYVCLKDFRQDTATRAGDAYCATYPGGANESAARIIFKVAQACGINPQVLLATLQKEQGLVTHTWPSDWRYTIAMGQGCPDTAACDTRYYGFYNQVLGAARQFRIYSANTYFTYYAPGKTWNVLFNPNHNCGSSPVFVENQATANLYYYTPYQPNAAALKAGLGEGDGCSAYGNRNFFTYFTDWFGSTQTSNLALVRTVSDPAIWLVSAGYRWHVRNGEDYNELARVFGQASIVGAPFITSLANAGVAGSVLRDASTGLIALIQDGQKHRLLSCDAVADFGGSCTAPTNVSSALMGRVASGADAGAFFRVRETQRWGRFEEGKAVTPLYNYAAAAALNGNPTGAPYAPYLNTDMYAAAPKRNTVFAPAQLVKSSSDPKVYLTLGFDTMVHVPSLAAVVDYNRFERDLAVVGPAELAGYSTTGTVAPLLSCDGTTYLPSAGWLNRIADPSKVGLPTMSGPAATCDQFSKRSARLAGSVAIKTASDPNVWVLEGGKRRLAPNWNLLVSYNSGVAPSVVVVSAGTRDAIPIGAVLGTGTAVPAPLVGTVIKAASSPELLLAGSSAVHWIPSGGLAADLGIKLAHRTIPDQEVWSLSRGTTLGSWLSCAGTTYFGAEGKLWPVSSAGSVGFTAVPIDAGACAVLTRATEALGLVAVKTSGSATVLIASGGSLRPVATWDALLRANGGIAPRILTVSSETVGALPGGPPIV